MGTAILENVNEIQKVQPLCPVFGQCGGCSYQDLPYEQELKIKENSLKNIFREKLGLADDLFEPILPSPQPYHYRNRLDLQLFNGKRDGVIIGFSPEGRFKVMSVDTCPIARKEISDFIPELKIQARQKLTAKHRVANLVVRCGDDGRVRWGGIGRGSLNLKEEDYLWAEVQGQRIFYSLDTFFQANLSILPKVIEYVRSIDVWTKDTLLFDLYSGVGLFGICLADRVKKVVMIEDSVHSLKLAQYNLAYHGSANIEIRPGKVETEFPAALISLAGSDQNKKVAFIDPPRAGLSPEVLSTLAANKSLDAILYLSCHPESLIRDLAGFLQENWEIKKVMPFDFFPKTRHIETLVLLKPKP